MSSNTEQTTPVTGSICQIVPVSPYTTSLVRMENARIPPIIEFTAVKKTYKNNLCL